MIRTSLFLALFCVSTAISAQDKHSVFLSKTAVSWYHNTVIDLEESVTNLASDDMNVKIRSKKQIKNNLRILNKNCKSMSLNMAGFLKDERINKLSKLQLSDGVEMSGMEQNNHRTRRNKNLVEIKMNKEDLATFNNNLEVIKKAEEELANAKYQLWSRDTKKSAMQPQLQAIAKSARANSEFLISNSIN